MPVPLDPGDDPEPASLARVLLDVPDRLLSPVVGALPDDPGEEPEPASVAPVPFDVPELPVPDDPDPVPPARA